MLENTVARRKIVFVIVEGPSDDEALGVLLNRIYDKNAVSFSVELPYLQSWVFNKEGKHSLERHTNFWLCIAKAFNRPGVPQNPSGKQS